MTAKPVVTSRYINAAIQRENISQFKAYGFCIMLYCARRTYYRRIPKRFSVKMADWASVLLRS